MLNVNSEINNIIEIEGGFVDHVNDKGGATNYGITARTYAAFLGVDRDYIYLTHLIKCMPKSTAFLIYKQNYYYDTGVDLLPSKLQAQVMDICINSGSNRAYKLLQQAINRVGGSDLVLDGKFGSKSWAALDLIGSQLTKINNNVCDCRIVFYNGLASIDKSQQVFLKGWLNRAEKFRI
jgi:lysozyme family protein